MKSSTRISKFKITIISLLIAVMIAPILLEPLTAYAANVITEGDAADDGTYTSSGDKWYATYATGCGYKGQGVLVYLLERNGGGAVAGTTPKAFPCHGNITSYELRAQDKYNRYPMVTTWESALPAWAGSVRDNGGLIHSQNTSNVELIKAWLATNQTNGSGQATTNGIVMVSNIWGSAVAQRFANEEIILIIEPIIANQFARYQEITTLSSLNSNSSIYEMRNVLRAFQTNIANQSNTSMSSDLSFLITNKIGQIDNLIAGRIPDSLEDGIRQSLLTDLDRLITGTNIYMPLGNPIAGTSKEVYKYYNELSVPSYLVVWNKCQPGMNYFRKAANSCTVLKTGSVVCANANFTLYDGSFAIKKAHDLSTIETYSIGMMAMLAWHNDSSTQTTCDETVNNPYEPHDPPNESTGTYTIIKTYRDRNSITNQLVHVDTTHRSNVHNQILIEDESEYTVVAWKIASQQNLSIQGPTWESSVPGHIQESGTDTALVECDPTHKYLYVLLEKGNGTLNVNYNLSQSQLTRHITINNPDNPTVNGTTMVNLSSLSFNWTIGAHTRTGCSGHRYYDGCHNSCPSNHSCGTNCFNNNTPLGVIFFA